MRKIVRVTTEQHLKFGTQPLMKQFSLSGNPGVVFAVEPPWVCITWQGQTFGVSPSRCVVEFEDAPDAPAKRGPGRPPKARGDVVTGIGQGERTGE